MIPHENDQILGSIRQLTESEMAMDRVLRLGTALAENASLKAENTRLKDKLDEYALIAWVMAIFLHESATNHTGDFEDCQVPVCKIAKKMRDHVDIKAAECFAEKEAAWLVAIAGLKAENARLRDAFRTALENGDIVGANHLVHRIEIIISRKLYDEITGDRP